MDSILKLQKMISLEIEQGYEDKAVIGGLKGILNWWPQQVRQEYALPEHRMLIDDIIALVSGYGAMQGAEGRKEAVADIEEKLTRLQASPIKATEGDTTGGISADNMATPLTAARTAVLQTTALPPTTLQAMASQAVTLQAVIPQSVAPQDVAKSASPSSRSEPPETEQSANLLSREGAPAKTNQASTLWDGERNHAYSGLDSPVTVISGVGPVQSKRLKKLGIETINDLIHFFPRRHEDYSRLKPIAKLEYGEQVTVIGTIRATKLKRHRGGAAIVNTIIADGSGTLQATWFNQPYLVDQLKRGRQIVLSGQVNEYLGQRVMTSPRWEPLEAEQISTGRLVPIYPLTEGLSANWLRKMLKQSVDYWSKRLPDYLPRPIRERLNLLSREQAVAQMHFPDDLNSLSQARRRLAFDEFFILQLGVLRQRQQWRSEPGTPIPANPSDLDTFLSALPYELTGAQRRALDEAIQDIASDRPMSRLLQGDVGSGKTIVAAAAMCLVAKAGYQAAIMAPTEILAEQHFKTLQPLLARHGISICLLTGSVPQTEKEAIYAEIASGAVQVITGTHAIIQENVQFHHLALAVVDEQHRFGVRQRGVLRGKGYNPHILVMSATPIPRTLALTAYGDLDLSIIDEMPPGRQPIQTKWFAPVERERAYRFVHAQVEKGRQAYIICPLVEESEKIEAKAAVEEHQRLQKAIFPDLRLGLLHGRLKSEEKEQVMRQFSNQELDILVSTSVVEVGIDVPNATVMMIEGADRFGLSQLHQFRGRVGRGEHQSYCILMADAVTAVGEERLRAIEETQDGFVLAQKDLEMRGPGDFFGTQQSGLPELKLASLGDTPLLETARHEAMALFQDDPTFSRPEHRLLADQVSRFWGNEGDLS